MTKSMQIRQARLDDTGAISALFRERIAVWQRLDDQGQVQSLPYEQLSLYERWLHGGPWMSIETSAIYLNHLLCGAAVPVVVVEEDRITGYAEAFPGDEPAPFGKHFHLSSCVSNNQTDALIGYLIDLGRERRQERLTVSVASYDQDMAQRYRSHGFQIIQQLTRYNVPAQTGQSFYRATEHPNAAQIRGWHMLIGRLESARYHWEMLWPNLWQAIPAITARRTNRLHISAAGQDALVCLQRQLYDTRSADVYCWSPRPLRSQLLTAIKDWAHRENYRTLMIAVPDSFARLLGDQAEAQPHTVDIYGLEL